MADDTLTLCRLGEHDGTFSLAFNDFDANGADSVFEEAGFDGGGYGSYGVASTFYTGALQTVTYHVPRY